MNASWNRKAGFAITVGQAFLCGGVLAVDVRETGERGGSSVLTHYRSRRYDSYLVEQKGMAYIVVVAAWYDKGVYYVCPMRRIFFAVRRRYIVVMLLKVSC